MVIIKKEHSYSWEDFFSLPWLVLLAISFVCLVAYVNSFQNQFMLDDNIILFGQRGVLNKSFLDIFTSTQGDFYRPVGHIPLWLFSRLLGSSYIGYHVLNYFLFVLIVFHVFIIVRKITSDAALSFLASMLYAIHPFNAMIINYITASVLAVFVLSMQASFLFFIGFLEHGKKKDYVFSLIFFIMACLSHEMAIMLPVYLAAYLFFIKKESWEKILGLLSFFLVFLVGWLVFRAQNALFPHQLSGVLTLATMDIASSFSTWMDLVTWYLSNLFLPNKVIFLWSAQYGQEHFLRNLLVFTLLVDLGVYAFFKWRRTWPSFLLAVFILGMIPSICSCFLNFPRVQPIIEPHWFYFSQIGFFVLLGWVLLTMVRKSHLIGGVFTGSIILLLLVYSWSYNALWENQEKYSLHWLSLNTGNLTPYYGLGRSLMEKGEYREASQVFLLGTQRLNYAHSPLAADLGHCFDMLGDDKSALNWFGLAVKWDSRYALTYHYYGLYFNKRADFSKAQEEFKKSVELDPKFSLSYPYLKK